MNTTVTVALAVGALVVLVAAVALRLADRLGLPSLLLYLALGVALGEGGLGVHFEDSALTQTLGVRRAGGHPRRGWADDPVGRRPAGDRARAGAVHRRRRGERRRDRGGRGVAARTPAGAPRCCWRRSISSTDAAAVFATLRRLPLPRRVAAVAGGRERPQRRARSSCCDRAVRVPHRAGSRAVVAGRRRWWSASWSAGRSSGWRSGSPGPRCCAGSRCPLAGFYPLATLALCVLAYSSATLAHTSGFVAVYLCGLVLGNAPLPHRAASVGFAEGMASLAQIGLFVLLGLLVSPGPAGRGGRARRWSIGGALLLLARPLSVVASLVVVPGPVASAGVHLVGRAARRGADRRWPHPADRGRPRGDDHLRHRLRAGRRLHRGPGLVAALGGPAARDRHAR